MYTRYTAIAACFANTSHNIYVLLNVTLTVNLWRPLKNISDSKEGQCCIVEKSTRTPCVYSCFGEVPLKENSAEHHAAYFNREARRFSEMKRS